LSEKEIAIPTNRDGIAVTKAPALTEALERVAPLLESPAPTARGEGIPLRFVLDCVPDLGR
jgi:hypothetical protein